MPLQRNKVILVNMNDEWVGITSKEDAHHNGLLHRAISIFIVNSKGEVLLQQRAADKYHSGGLWSNACCSHPAPGESSQAAARRRLKEELGIETPLEKVTSFYYQAQVSDTMKEHEFDHIFLGTYDGEPVPDAAEVQAYKWVPEDELRTWMQANPQQFSAWFEPIYTAWQSAGSPQLQKPTGKDQQAFS